MDAYVQGLGLKDLLTLVTTVSGLIFSLIANRRAKAAEERAIRADERSTRAEKQELTDSAVSERERALGEIHAMKAAWSSRVAMVGMYDPSDTTFNGIVSEQVAVLDLAASSIRAVAPQIATHEDLVGFRTSWIAGLQEMRAQDTAIEKLFGEFIEKLKAERRSLGTSRSDT